MVNAPRRATTGPTGASNTRGLPAGSRQARPPSSRPGHRRHRSPMRRGGTLVNLRRQRDAACPRCRGRRSFSREELEENRKRPDGAQHAQRQPDVKDPLEVDVLAPPDGGEHGPADQPRDDRECRLAGQRPDAGGALKISRNPLNAWCELGGEDLSGRCPRPRAVLEKVDLPQTVHFRFSLWERREPGGGPSICFRDHSFRETL